VPLTVDFHEPQFLDRLNAENAFVMRHGFWFQLSRAERNIAKAHRGSANPQELDWYTYALNNPTRPTDPAGHCLWDLGIVEGIGLGEVLLIAGGVAIVATYTVSPNAEE
jgi:hypothetical protein